MPADNQERLRISDELYDRYGKPLESEHWGEYLAIFPDGRTVVGRSLLKVADEALSEFGRGSFLFRIGERAVGRIR